MPGRVSTPSDPSLEPEDWQKIWRRLKKLCLVTQRAKSRLLSVTARPDDIFGDAETFARYKVDIKRKKRYQDIKYFSRLSRFQMSRILLVRALNLEFSSLLSQA